MIEEVRNIPLAVVGMSCRLPRADGLDEFWQLLVKGRSAVTEIPNDRLDRRLYYDPEKGVRGKTYTTIGCLVDYPPPDLSICPLTEAQIALHDPAHVTMVEIAAKACVHAGFDPFAMPKARAGVYVGHTRGSPLGGDRTYAHLVEHTAQYLRDIEDFSERTGSDVSEVIDDIVRSVRARYAQREPGRVPNLAGSQAAGLVARALQLDGPFMAVNAACASSLQALSLAARALQLGEIDLAIVGGAAYCRVDSLILFSQAQSVSATGSRPFDADADGLVNGEGYVALVIEPLERAVARGSRIHAVIRGIGMSCDGSGKSLWAPRKEGQIAAMRRAYDHGVAMNRVQYIEAHATSTQVGDATELTALGELLNESLGKGTKIPVGSVKANIGHTIEAAGLAGLLKTILSLEHHTIPPAINVETLNPKIDWVRTPFYVPRTAIPWPEQPDGQPRCAGVNSFGIGGLNVHVVVQEFTSGQESAVRSTATETETPRAGPTAEEPIAIIGMGAILPGALDTETYWELLVRGSDPKQNAPRARLDAALSHVPGARIPFRTPTVLGGFITDFQYDWRRRKIPPKQIANADPLQFMLLEAVEQALEMSGRAARKMDHQRTGVYVGALSAGEFHEQLQMGLRLPEFQEELARVLRRCRVLPSEIQAISQEFAAILLERMPALLDETGSYTTNTLASRITKTFNFMGGAAAIDAEKASAAAALNASVNSLRARDCDLVVCAAGHRGMGPAAYELLSLEGNLSLGAPRSPFDAQASGFVPGEGAAAVVLKRLSDARRDGDEVLGSIRGIGIARDDCYESAVGEAVRRGLSAARIDADRVSCVETVGRAEPTLDTQEFKALLNCFGQSRRLQPLALGSITSQLGQLGAAHTMAGLIKIVLALRHGRFPGNVALGETSALLNDQSALSASKDSLTLSPSRDGAPPAGGLSSCADAQLGYHLVIEGCGESMSSATAAQSTEAAWRIFRFEGREPSELLTQLDRAASHADAEYRTSGGNFTAGHAKRLAIVAETPADLAAKCQLARQELMQRQAHPLLRERGIFYSENGQRRPRVAFLFPGQGSQYAGMLRSLVQEFEPAQQAVHRIDRVLSGLGYPSVARVLWQEGEQLGKSVWRTQLSLLIADTVFYLCLAALRIFPDRVAGHSFGEFASLIAAGAWNFENAARATRARSAAIEATPEAQGIMMSVKAPVSVIEERLGKRRARAYVACYNTPEQTVVAGSRPAVLELAEQLTRDNILAQVIHTPAPFHTPLMEAVKAPFGEALAELVLEPPRVPVLSSVHGRYLADPDDMRTALVTQMTTPVLYFHLVQRLAKEGIEIFVEVGPQQVLTRLNRQILKDSEAIAIGTDQAKKNPLQQLLNVQACLESAGAVSQSPEEAGARVFGEILPARSTPGVEKNRRRAAASAQNASAVRPAGEEAPAHPLNSLELSGTPHDMGLQHGRAHSSLIRTVLRRYADLAGVWDDDGAGTLAAAVQPEAFFATAELQELEGIAAGAGVPLAAIIAHNLRLQPKIGGSTHFAVAAGHNDDAGLVHCVNEDQPLILRVRGCLLRSLQARFPKGGIPALIFGTVGQMGGFSGVNARGLAVSSARMCDTAPSRTTGRLHAAIVKHILESSGDIGEALALLESTNAAGAWALCLSHTPTDELCYAEYNGNGFTVRRHQGLVAGASPSSFGRMSADAVPHSRHRLLRLQQLLDETRQSAGGMTVRRAQAALRDRFDVGRSRETAHPTMNTVCRVDNHMSLIMQPAQGKAWVLAGVEAGAARTQFVELDVRELLASNREAPAAGSTHLETKPRPASPQSPIREHTNTEEPPVCQRLVPQLVEATHPREERSFLQGPALILGENPVARALEEKIGAAGGTALTVPACADLDNTLARVDDFCRLHLPPHLFLLTPCDAEARTAWDVSRWQRRRIAGVSLPYFVCQRWYQFLLEAERIASASMVGVTALGGDFGFSGSINSAESGAITGLIKACKRELQANGLRGFTAKVIDVADNDPPEETVRAIFRELGTPDEQTEVSWAGGRRCVVRVAARPAHPANPEAAIARGAVWLVTGGARGITAAAARELARNHDLKLHLIGSSPLPRLDKSWHQLSEAGIKALRAKVMKEALARGEVPVTAWNQVTTDLEIDRNLDAYAAAGVRFNYHCCDITDYDRLRRVLQEIRNVDGPIEGVLHGAAFESAIRFDKKRREAVERTIAVKVDGAVHLMDLTQNDPIRHFIAFGSISGRFGGIGQTDYSAANDFMAKLVSWYGSQRPELKTTTFHWHAWDDIGMAVRPENSYLKRYSDVRYMPAREGIRHFLDEVSAGLPVKEVVVTDASRYEDLRSPSIAHHESESSRDGLEGADTHSSRPDVSHLPFIDAIKHAEENGAITAELCLDPTRDPFLLQHLFKGRPLMPGVIGMAAMAQAASILLGEKGVTLLRSVEFVAPLRFHTDRKQVARVYVANEAGEIACRLTADFVNRAGQTVETDRLHARAVVGVLDSPSTQRHPPADRPVSWLPFQYPADGIISHGQDFRCLKAIRIDETVAWGRVVASSAKLLARARTGDRWILPAAALDAGFVLCGIHARLRHRGRMFQVPRRVERLELLRQATAGEELYVRAVARSDSTEHTKYDFTILDKEGAVVAEVCGYTGFMVSDS